MAVGKTKIFFMLHILNLRVYNYKWQAINHVKLKFLMTNHMSLNLVNLISFTQEGQNNINLREPVVE